VAQSVESANHRLPLKKDVRFSSARFHEGPFLRDAIEGINQKRLTRYYNVK
jgi:hypothetical protein